MAQALPEGIYEHLITEELQAALSALGSGLAADRRPLGSADGAAVLARYLSAEIEQALLALPAEQRLKKARKLVNQVLAQLAQLGGSKAEEEQPPLRRVPSPPEQFLAVYPGASRPPRPVTPLSISTLLTQRRGGASRSARPAAASGFSPPCSRERRRARRSSSSPPYAASRSSLVRPAAHPPPRQGVALPPRLPSASRCDPAARALPAGDPRSPRG